MENLGLSVAANMTSFALEYSIQCLRDSMSVNSVGNARDFEV